LDCLDGDVLVGLVAGGVEGAVCVRGEHVRWHLGQAQALLLLQRA